MIRSTMKNYIFYILCLNNDIFPILGEVLLLKYINQRMLFTTRPLLTSDRIYIV